MLHLFLQFQATSSNSSFGEPGPHAIHTGRTCFLPGKTNKLKMMCLYQKNPFISSRISFSGGNELRFFRDHFLLESSHSTDFVVQRKKNTQKGLGGYFEARHHGFNFINLRKTIQHGPPSSKSVGMRMAWGLMVRSWFSPKKDGGKGKEHVKQTNESNKSET